MSDINVLFMQSQSYFGSDSMVHGLIMEHLDRSRVTVHVACNPGSSGKKSRALAALEQIPNLHVRPTNFGPTLNTLTAAEVVRDTVVHGIPSLASIAGLARYARKHQINLVHGTEKPRDAFYGLLVARSCGAKALTHLHVKVEDWMSPLVKWAMGHDDALLGVSKFVAESAVAKGHPTDRVFWVVNSIDASRWNPDTDGTAVRREFGIADHTPVISIISRICPWKGHEILLQALGEAARTEKRFMLLIVGEDDPRATPGGGSYIAQLEPMVKDLSLEGNVIFTGLRSDVRQILAATDIYAMPTFEEPCAVAFLEAMAMRKPIVALDSGGTPQEVDDGKSGLLSPVGDVHALAQNLLRLIGDTDERGRMGMFARSRIESYFTPQRLADDVEQVYRRVLSLPSVAAPDPTLTDAYR